MDHDRPTPAQRILELVDLTLLGDDDTEDEIVALCAAATTAHGRVAAVCVWPRWVATAVRCLEGTGIPVAGVANFPLGADDPELAVGDSLAIVAAGGREVDVVFPWRDLMAGTRGRGTDLVRAVRSALPDDVVLKVILESGELVDPELIGLAAGEAIDGGADFLKTSTGKTERSATPEAVAQLLAIVSNHDPTPSARQVGVKVSGGVRTLDQAVEYLELADGALGSEAVSRSTLRFGASSLVDALVAELDDAG